MSVDETAETKPVRRCGACCEVMVPKFHEGPSKFAKRKYCSNACLAVVNANRFKSKKRGGDK